MFTLKGLNSIFNCIGDILLFTPFSLFQATFSLSAGPGSNSNNPHSTLMVSAEIEKELDDAEVPRGLDVVVSYIVVVYNIIYIP